MRRILAFMLMTAAVLGVASMAAAAAEATGQPDSTAKAAIALGSGLAIAIAAFGAALGQGRMAAAAMESIGRNPNAADRIQLPMILGLAFIEALALYGFVIAYFLQGKI
jgi:F-type H+-transporting ATPase subunit c